MRYLRLSTAGMSERGSFSQMTGMRSGYLAGRGGCRARGDERVGQRAREKSVALAREERWRLWVAAATAARGRRWGEKGRHRPAIGSRARGARARQRSAWEAQHGGGVCGCVLACAALSLFADAQRLLRALVEGVVLLVGELIRLRHRSDLRARHTPSASARAHIIFIPGQRGPNRQRGGSGVRRGERDTGGSGAAGVAASARCREGAATSTRAAHAGQASRRAHARRSTLLAFSPRESRQGRTGRKIYSWRHFSMMCAHLWNHITAASHLASSCELTPPPMWWRLCCMLGGIPDTKSRPPCGRRTHRTDRRHTTR